MPEFKPVRSSVVPEGTVTPLRTIVAQDFFDLEAAAAPEEPEKVQEALFSRSGGAVGAGAAGAAATSEAAVARRLTRVEI